MNLRPLTSAMYAVTHACNLQCRYCFVKQEHLYTNYDVAKRLVHFLISNANGTDDVPNITFFGGEPFLMWDEIIKPLVLYIREDLKTPFTLSITTNGTLVDEDKLKFMKDNGVGILFSCDGDKITQDYNRVTHSGESSFSLIEHNVDKIIQYFPNTHFRSTVIPDTCQYTFDNIMFAERHKYKTFFTTPNIFQKWNDDSKYELANQIKMYSDYYINSYRCGRSPIKFTSMEETMKRICDINTASSKGDYRKAPYCCGEGKCGMSSNRFCGVSPDGMIYSCQEMTSNVSSDSIFYIGNLFDGIDNKKRAALVEMYCPEKATGLNCKECKYDRVCDGGCVANNYFINGDIHINQPDYCWWRQLLLDNAIYIVQTLGNDKNEAFRDYWVKINER